ncbi:MAG: hypothetical protein C0501_26925 [Isosphaera sp.]|nr:hypothetical protein [Isosphaera sp.]
MRGGAWVLAAVLATAAAAPARAQSGPLAPAGGTPDAASGFLPPDDPAPAARADRPPNVLGAPVGPADRPPPRPDRVEPASRTVPAPEPAPRRASLGAPESGGRPVAPRAGEPSVRPAPLPDRDPVDDLLSTRAATRRTKGRDGDDPDRSAGKFGDKIGAAIGGVFGEGRDWFKSDHAFDGFISPVTNPFLFEDPRSLTEVRPLFVYQKVPSKQPNFKGGDIFFYGTQARVAFTDRFSFTINKLGGISVNSGSGSAVQDGSGFAELWLGPKYTFLRGEATGSLLAGGLMFQVPTGSQRTFQDTGSLSLVPYLTYGQNLFRDFALGSVNALVGTGYSFGTDSKRSDYYYLSAHLDLDYRNNHKFYPLFELNWLIHTSNGGASPMVGEGRDLLNIGSQAKGAGLLTGAFGARYKITECAQVGGAFEFPFVGPRDLFRYRFTLDFSLRY